MQIAEVMEHLERIAPPALQESYDNSGLIVGRTDWEVKGILVSLDCIEATVEEAQRRGCNLIVSHHPIVFSGIKRFNGQGYVERTVEMAIKNDIAIYAIHTNLDNVYHGGVNARIAAQLELQNTRILSPKQDVLKLVTYAPKSAADSVREVLFEAGAGRIGNYSECSFATEGEGSFKPNSAANPTLGEKGKRHYEEEVKIEVVMRTHQQHAVVRALQAAHPYEEVAYEVYPTLNIDQAVGSGMIGELHQPMQADDFLAYLKEKMELEVVRYTPVKHTIHKVALCGGSGQFLLPVAKGQKADVFVTADFKYHQFFDGEGTLMICDIGHYESEKYTIDLLYDVLSKNFSNFAVLKTDEVSNPVKYFQ